MPGDLQRTIAEFHDVLFPAGAVEPASVTANGDNAEAVFMQRLLAAGIITKINDSRTASFARNEFKPIKIHGKPLSETIVEERG